MRKQTHKQERAPITVRLIIVREGQPSAEYLALWRRLLAPVAPDTTPAPQEEER